VPGQSNPNVLYRHYETTSYYNLLNFVSFGSIISSCFESKKELSLHLKYSFCRPLDSAAWNKGKGKVNPTTDHEGQKGKEV
jgi:hypothetical protein